MDSMAWQYALLAVVLLGLVAGFLDTRGKVIERTLLIAGGFCLVLLEIGLNYFVSAISIVPGRTIGEILLFRRAPPGDILVPIAYLLMATGIGSLVRKFAEKALRG